MVLNLIVSISFVEREEGKKNVEEEEEDQY